MGGGGGSVMACFLEDFLTLFTARALSIGSRDSELVMIFFSPRFFDNSGCGLLMPFFTGTAFTGTVLSGNACFLAGTLFFNEELFFGLLTDFLPVFADFFFPGLFFTGINAVFKKFQLCTL